MQTSQLSVVYLQQDFSQRADHMEGTILFPGVRGRISENLVAEAHGLLQHLKKKKKQETTKKLDQACELWGQRQDLFYFSIVRSKQFPGNAPEMHTMMKILVTLSQMENSSACSRESSSLKLLSLAFSFRSFPHMHQLAPPHYVSSCVCAVDFPHRQRYV